MTPSELRALSFTELMALLPPDRLSDIPGAETEFSARLACQELGCSRYEIPKEWLRANRAGNAKPDVTPSAGGSEILEKP